MSKYSLLIAAVFSLVSSLRVPALPLIQFVVIVVLLLRRIDKYAIGAIILVLSSHHYAIPDHIFRFNSSVYPSIYTWSIFGFRILDLFILVIFFSGILSGIIRNKTISVKSHYIVLFFCANIGILLLNKDSLALDMFLFLSRSWILFIGLLLHLWSLNKNEIITIIDISIYAWIFKMFWSIIFVHPNPLYREIFGVKGIIYFAGDEYVSIGPLLVVRYILSGQKKGSYFIILVVLLLGLIAQRKGVLLYTFTLFIIFQGIASRLIEKLSKWFLVFYEWSILVFMLFLEQSSLMLLKLAFREYSLLAYSAIDSIAFLAKESFLRFLFGLSTIGKYRIMNLPWQADHPMSFGSEVGQDWRFAIWNIPYGRALLNLGILGSLYFFVLVFRQMGRLDSRVFYLELLILMSFSGAVLTPVGSIPLAFAFLLMNKFYEKNCLR